MTRTVTFTAVARGRQRGGIAIDLPFDLASVWGERDRYYLAGSIQQYPMRDVVSGDTGAPPVLELGPAWCRDPRVGPGANARAAIADGRPVLVSGASLQQTSVKLRARGP
jgi:hypothetical protein